MSWSRGIFGARLQLSDSPANHQMSWSTVRTIYPRTVLLSLCPSTHFSRQHTHLLHLTPCSQNKHAKKRMRLHALRQPPSVVLRTSYYYVLVRGTYEVLVLCTCTIYMCTSVPGARTCACICACVCAYTLHI